LNREALDTNTTDELELVTVSTGNTRTLHRSDIYDAER
jgi:hypothetical protein